MTTRLRHLIAALVVGMAAMVVLSACGNTSGDGNPGGDLKGVSASDAMKKAREAAKSATAVTVNARPAAYTTVVSSMGPDSGVTTITVDPKSGASPAPSGVASEKVEIRSIGDTVYVKADQKFWDAEVGKSGAATVGDKWVSAKAGTQLYQRVGAFTTKETLTSSLLATGDTRLKYAETQEINGVKAVKIVEDTSSPSGSASPSGSSSPSASPSVTPSGSDVPGIWIAVDSPNYPVKLEGPGGPGQPPVSYEFVDWGKAPTVEAPPASDVIPYAKIAPKKK